jgi:iron complex outermembrane receptor protein
MSRFIHMTKLSLAVGAATAALAIAASAAYAQDAAPAASRADDEIVVTAQRRGERSVDVPITVTTLSSEDLQQTNFDDIADLQRLTPGLRVDYRPAIQPSIRGIGNSVAVEGTGNNVAIYVDGFYTQTPLSADFKLPNIDNIQVLKGPQGTLFGRNSTGGAVLITTSTPSTETSGSLTATYGTYNTQRYSFYGTTGVTDNIAVDLAGFYGSGDGYIDNLITGADDDGAYESWTARAGLLVDFTDRLSALLRVSHSIVSDPSVVLPNSYAFPGQPPLSYGPYIGGAVSSTPQTITTTRNPFGEFPYDEVEADSIQLQLTYDFDFATLNSYTHYRDTSHDYMLDTDFTSAQYHLVRGTTEEEIFTQEIVLASDPGGPLQWTAGLFYINDPVTYHIRRRTNNGPFANLQQAAWTTSAAAVFADITYEIVPNLFLTGGIRYSEDRVEDISNASGGGAAVLYPDIEETRTTSRFVVRYAPTEDSSVYFSYSQGYKASLANVGAPVTALIEPEELDAFEVGYKYDGDVFSIDFSAFHYAYTNLQLSSSSPAGVLLLRNAADSTIDGFETAISYNVTPDFQISLGATFLDATYDNFPFATRWEQCLSALTCGPLTFPGALGQFYNVTTDASGRQLIRTPKFSGNISASYLLHDVFGGEVLITGNYYQVSNRYFDISSQFPMGGYETLSLRAEWTSPDERYTLAVWGDNVTDTEYRTAFFPTANGIANNWGEPAIFGVELGVNF